MKTIGFLFGFLVFTQAYAEPDVHECVNAKVRQQFALSEGRSGPLFPNPTRKEIKRVAQELIPALILGKRMLGKNGKAWQILSQMGNGNCGECVELLEESFRLLFGHNVRILDNQADGLDFPLGAGHTYFVVQSHDPQKPQKLIVDFSWTQWFNPYLHTTPHERGRIPIVFIGTHKELRKYLKDHPDHIRDTWLNSNLLSLDEIFDQLYFHEGDFDSRASILDQRLMARAAATIEYHQSSGSPLDLFELDITLLDFIFLRALDRRIKIRLTLTEGDHREGILERFDDENLVINGESIDIGLIEAIGFPK